MDSRKSKVSLAQRDHENFEAAVDAARAFSARNSGLPASFLTASAMLAEFSGSKYTPASPSISGIGPRSEQAIGRPAAMLSIKMLGMFSQLDAKTHISAAS